MSGNLTGKIFIFVGMVRDLKISAVLSERTETPDILDLSPNPREKNFFSSNLSLMVGGLVIIRQQTDDQEEGLGSLRTPAEVLSAVYHDSVPQGSFIRQAE